MLGLGVDELGVRAHAEQADGRQRDGPGEHLSGKRGRCGRPARTHLPIGEAGGRRELDLALPGRTGGRIGRRLWAAAVFDLGAHGDEVEGDGVAEAGRQLEVQQLVAAEEEGLVLREGEAQRLPW